MRFKNSEGDAWHQAWDLPGYFLVFGSKKRPVFGGEAYLDWGQPPIGVFQAEDAEAACRAAARASNDMGTFVAVPCFAWGVEFDEPVAREVGRTSPSMRAEERMERLALAIERSQETINRLALEAGKGDGERSE